ncbi:uncharacterized protein LAJ45_00527 [Morchella importuna]|uniref:uncharacterized protein n=1 Tax=Morchella importuna TaxID=1174673 RepID=UPI001E8CBF2C|nr:uncharacterized protein LAJ45_00527 [Morchella importuna]KAH8155517.1 hypothetical protein LAJ45_00527 [Morchella importuna]
MKDYTDLTKLELIELLRNRGLSLLGVKDALISRLEEYDHTHDPSPSPQLHNSPAISRLERPKPTTTPQLPVSDTHISRSSLFSNDILTSDEGDYANWEKTYGDVALKTSKTPDPESKKPPAPRSGPVPKVSFSIPKSELSTSVFSESDTTTDKNPSETETTATVPGSLPIDRVTKTGFKYKSLAAEFYPAQEKTINPSTKPFSIALPPTSTITIHPGASTGNIVTMSPSDLVSAGSAASSATLDHLKISPTTTITSIVEEINAVATTGVTSSLSKKDGDFKPRTESVSFKTTKSGFKFNSIASLFPEAKASTKSSKSNGHPIKAHSSFQPTDTLTVSAKQNPTREIAASAAPSSMPTLVRIAKLSEAEKLSLRAKRFGIPQKDELPVTTKARREGRFGVAELVDNYERIKDRGRNHKSEKEKEKEKEREKRGEGRGIIGGGFLAARGLDTKMRTISTTTVSTGLFASGSLAQA